MEYQNSGEMCQLGKNMCQDILQQISAFRLLRLHCQNLSSDLLMDNIEAVIKETGQGSLDNVELKPPPLFSYDSNYKINKTPSILPLTSTHHNHQIDHPSLNDLGVEWIDSGAKAISPVKNQTTEKRKRGRPKKNLTNFTPNIREQMKKCGRPRKRQPSPYNDDTLNGDVVLSTPLPAPLKLSPKTIESSEVEPKDSDQEDGDTIYLKNPPENFDLVRSLSARVPLKRVKVSVLPKKKVDGNLRGSHSNSPATLTLSTRKRRFQDRMVMVGNKVTPRATPEQVNLKIRPFLAPGESTFSYECLDCQKVYQKRVVVSAHVRLVHLCERQFCEVCLRVFYNVPLLQKHQLQSGCLNEPNGPGVGKVVRPFRNGKLKKRGRPFKKILNPTILNPVQVEAE